MDDLFVNGITLSQLNVFINVALLHRLLAKQIVFYFKSIDPDAVFKYVPGSGDRAGWFVKWRGQEPKKVDPEKSNLLIDSLQEFEEISKEGFEIFE